MSKTPVEGEIPVGVRLVDGVHRCTPTETFVHGGETIFWDGAGTILVGFPGDSPFVEGSGPFSNGERVTVKSKPPLKQGQVFVPEITVDGKLRKTEGDIKVT